MKKLREELIGKLNLKKGDKVLVTTGRNDLEYISKNRKIRSDLCSRLCKRNALCCIL